MKLYFNPRSRATIAKWMLDECRADYEIVPIDLERREQKSPEYLAINPAGKLPALVDGQVKLFENAAICLYLGDRFPQANLAPKIGAAERGRYLSLVVYATSQLEPAMGDAAFGLEVRASRGWTDLETVKDVIEGQIGKGPYLFGDWFTAADIMIGAMFMWKSIWDKTPERPRIQAYIDRLSARPCAPRMGP